MSEFPSDSSPIRMITEAEALEIEKTSQVVEPDTVHNDPNDPIVIISNDNIKFRASIFHLVRTSELFDDLLEIVHPAGGSLTQNHEPIHLDFPGSVITLFLDHISTSNSSIPIMTVTEIASLLIFAEFAICDSLIDKARARLIGATKECPFELLVLASDRDDIELAKDALRVMMSIHYHHEFNISGPHEFVYNHKNVKIVNYLQRLSLAFRFALREASRRAMEIRGSKYVDGMPGRYLVDHWANTLADDFEFTKYTRAIPPIHRPVQTIYFWTQ